jgi:hypothetical protein
MQHLTHSGGIPMDKAKVEQLRLKQEVTHNIPLVVGGATLDDLTLAEAAYEYVEDDATLVEHLGKLGKLS